MIILSKFTWWWWWCDRLLSLLIGRSPKMRSSSAISISDSIIYLRGFSTTKLMPPWCPLLSAWCSRFRRWWWWWWWWCRCCREFARELGPETTPLGCISGLNEEWCWWLWLALLCRPLTCLGVDAILMLLNFFKSNSTLGCAEIPPSAAGLDTSHIRE